MKDRIYLIVTKRGVDRMVKSDNFTLKPGERVFQVAVSVADAVFAPPRVPTITLDVPEDVMEVPMQIETGFASEETDPSVS